MAIVILRAGDALKEVAARRGEYPKWIMDTVGAAWSGGWSEHDVRSDGALPAFEGVDAFVMTGSASSVTERAPWMLRTEEYLRAIVASDVPLLGICFGHQMLAQALGGVVTKNPRGREIGTVRVTETPDGANDMLFAGVARSFDANATHVDSVTRVPAGARVLATTALDPCASFGVGERVRAVQFHPEFDGDCMRGYVKVRTEMLKGEGLDAEATFSRAKDAPGGAETLRNFVRCFVPWRRAAF